MRTCIFDPRMGVSGDMVVAALIDCGADSEKVKLAMERAGGVLAPTKVEISRVTRCGLQATHVDVETEEVVKMKAPQMERALEDAIRASGVGNTNFARLCLDTLLLAESHVHGVSRDDLTLHETGSADTLADIIGSSAACEELGLFGCEIVSKPVVTGYGFCRTQHGIMPVPAPATAEILKGMVIEEGSVEGELATPTGAAILKNLVTRQVPHIPPMLLEGVGYGAGHKDFSFPNVLKVAMGQCDVRSEEIVVLETNLDDVTGEVLGHAVAGLDCLDFAIFHATTKKNRPGYMLQVICEKGREGEVAEYLFRKTGSLGIRVRTLDRFVLERESGKVGVEGEEIGLKTSRLGGKIVRRKPEFGDLERLAKKKGISIFEAERMVVKDDENADTD